MGRAQILSIQIVKPERFPGCESRILEMSSEITSSREVSL
jgi:hypothetical protein